MGATGTAASMRARRHAGRGRAGFALLTVVWGLAVITAVAALAIVGARYRARDTGHTVAIARARAAAESGITLGIARLARRDPALWRDPQMRCRLPDGARLRVSFAREAGKVDLNAAPPALLAQFFTALTASGPRGAALAAAVVAFRTPSDRPADAGLQSAYEADGRPEGPKRAPFRSVLEFDQVVGVSPALLFAALPHLTVASGRPDLDAAAASPALRRLLGLPENASSPAQAGPPDAAPAGAVTIRADALSPEGARAIREALVSFDAGGEAPRVTDWRWGEADGAGPSPEGAPEGPCL